MSWWEGFDLDDGGLVVLFLVFAAGHAALRWWAARRLP